MYNNQGDDETTIQTERRKMIFSQRFEKAKRFKTAFYLTLKVFVAIAEVSIRHDYTRKTDEIVFKVYGFHGNGEKFTALVPECQLSDFCL